MGSMTRLEIVTQGIAVVGRTDLTTTVTSDLKSWLRSQYRAWPFAFLRKSASVSLPAGTTALPVGAGEASITNEIQRILNPLFLMSGNYSSQSKAFIINLDNTGLGQDERLFDPVTRRGAPTQFKVRHVLSTVAPFRSAWKLIPIPVPEKTYTLNFDYIELPSDPCPNTTSIPLYPNDQTMIQLCKVRALEYANGPSDPDYQSALADLGSMVSFDRIHEAQVPGTNDLIQMDPATFR